MKNEENLEKEFSEAISLLEMLKKEKCFDYSDNDIVSYAITLYHSLADDMQNKTHLEAN